MTDNIRSMINVGPEEYQDEVYTLDYSSIGKNFVISDCCCYLVVCVTLGNCLFPNVLHECEV